MSLHIISFTENGIYLSERLARCIEEETVLYTKCSMCRADSLPFSVQYTEESIEDWARKRMEGKHALLFIGACGIAVRAIAASVVDKLQDSPVLVMDENGGYIIPVLSGHMGGANALALTIAERMGAVPVITTATDINGKFAVDIFAKKNGLRIVNKDGIAKVSARVLAGREITMSVMPEHMGDCAGKPDGIRIVSYPPDEPVDILVTKECEHIQALLYLQPREYVIGIGCKKGKEADKIETFIRKNLAEAGVSTEEIVTLSSVNRKKEEAGLLMWSRKNQIPFVTFSAEQLNALEGDFHGSPFVREQVGVDNVCERAALAACGKNGRLVYEKHAEDGMTIAIAKRDWSVGFDES